MSAAQHARRTEAIERLQAYRDAGRFPQNRDFVNQRLPYFVDADGTRCAMAHLIEASGDAALVEAVASSRNNAFVKELADEPALIDWLETNGLTVEEAARIQPSYGCFAKGACLCGGFEGPTSGLVVGTWTATSRYWGIRVDEVHGEVPGVEVGTLLDGFADTEERTGRALALYRTDVTTTQAYPIGPEMPIAADDTVDCGGARVAVTVAANAVGAPDCMERLGAVDAALADNSHCSDGGCETTRPSAGWVTSVMLLPLAVVGLAWARRRRLSP